MKRIVSLLIVVITLLSLTSTSLATTKEFDLIEYLETHDVKTYEEFRNVLEANVDSSLVGMCTYPLIRISDQNQIKEEVFNISIDYENELVEVDIVYSAAALSTKRATASHETYSALGWLVYTVNITGTFSYASGTCTTTSKSGSFETPTTSFWSSTPTITSGNMVSTKSYARISGTATYLWETSTYELTLMCDSSGNITSAFTRP